MTPTQYGLYLLCTGQPFPPRNGKTSEECRNAYIAMLVRFIKYGLDMGYEAPHF